jgi:nucleoside-diphosphate-sugar epimerase
VYVVFGAAGAVGSDLVGRLVAQPGATVFASDRDTSALDNLKDAHVVPADTLDHEAVRLASCLSSVGSQIMHRRYTCHCFCRRPQHAGNTVHSACGV